MPAKAPGEAAPSVSQAARDSWYVFKHFNEGSSKDPQLSYLAGYQRCAADMMVDLFELRGFDSLLERVLGAFEYLTREREAIRMATEELKETQD